MIVFRARHRRQACHRPEKASYLKLRCARPLYIAERVWISHVKENETPHLINDPSVICMHNPFEPYRAKVQLSLQKLHAEWTPDWLCNSSHSYHPKNNLALDEMIVQTTNPPAKQLGYNLPRTWDEKTNKFNTNSVRMRHTSLIARKFSKTVRWDTLRYV